MAQVMAAIANGPRLLWQRWRGTYSPLETALLDALVARVDAATAQVLSSQRGEINFVQRLTAPTSESDLYRFVDFRVSLDRTEKFTFVDDEVLLATCTFRAPRFDPVRVGFWVVGGVLFSLEFDADVRRILKVAEIAVLSFEQHASAAV